MANLLEIKDAQRQIGDSFALRNVDLAVAPGEIVGFVGANGAGKTTTIRAALGLMKLDAGELRLFGEPFGPNAPDSIQRRVRPRIGVVFDTCPYPAEFTIAQVERCVAPAFPDWDKAQFWRLAEQFSLSRKAKVKDLSRGMGMKLQLAVALLHKADLLVLDEATAGLDPIARDGVLTALREFAAQEGHGALLSSHITSDLDRVADRVVGIHDGRIIFDMPREEITDMAGIAHCTAEQARSILECVEGARIERHEFSCDALVPNRFEFAEAFPEIPCDHASIEDYLRFTLKGIAQ
ncbi:ABC transporter ATP-binding protein [uncultured Slackia sp.]|uniref:ABC transporter ATP-binding protein n=1 Tax=uncultured Slackia sp. TaxID=665903 RepID=UPI0025E03A5E|nr:ABC transporter ATP-binding protein [uncultured Slackia sp.]